MQQRKAPSIMSDEVLLGVVAENPKEIIGVDRQDIYVAKYAHQVILVNPDGTPVDFGSGGGGGGGEATLPEGFVERIDTLEKFVGLVIDDYEHVNKTAGSTEPAGIIQSINKSGVSSAFAIPLPATFNGTLATVRYAIYTNNFNHNRYIMSGNIAPTTIVYNELDVAHVKDANGITAWDIPNSLVIDVNTNYWLIIEHSGTHDTTGTVYGGGHSTMLFNADTGVKGVWRDFSEKPFINIDYVETTLTNPDAVPKILTVGEVNDLTERVDQVFTQVSSGKSLLETKVLAKGGTVIKAGDIPTFEELGVGIDSIQQGSGGTPAVQTLSSFIEDAGTNYARYKGFLSIKQVASFVYEELELGAKYFCVITTSYNGGAYYLFSTKGSYINVGSTGIITSDGDMRTRDASGDQYDDQAINDRDRGKTVDFTAYMPVIKHSSYDATLGATLPPGTGEGATFDNFVVYSVTTDIQTPKTGTLADTVDFTSVLSPSDNVTITLK